MGEGDVCWLNSGTKLSCGVKGSHSVSTCSLSMNQSKILNAQKTKKTTKKEIPCGLFWEVEQMLCRAFESSESSAQKVPQSVGSWLLLLLLLSFFPSSRVHGRAGGRGSGMQAWREKSITARTFILVEDGRLSSRFSFWHRRGNQAKCMIRGLLLLSFTPTPDLQCSSIWSNL